MKTNSIEKNSASTTPSDESLVNLNASRRMDCCGRPTGVWLGRIALATLVAIAVAAAYMAGVERQTSSRTADPNITWQGLPIANATAAVSSEKFSMCTGPISDQTEGLFVLDHNSGLLQCTVIYPRLGRFMATFTVNVAEALGMDAKGGNYMMVTGTADFIANSNQPLAASVVYVLDTASGNYACYGIPFSRVALKANQPQQGALFLVGQGAANPVVSRDELR